MRTIHEPLGYVAALAIPLGVMLVGAQVGMPAFVFEHLVVLFVVGIAVFWGMRPAVLTALAAALGDNVFLRDPTGRPTISGVRDILDLALFVGVAVTVGWLVASARRDRALAEAAVRRERQARSERDRLISMISHDLATPLAVVRNAVQLARLTGNRPGLDIDRLWDRLDTATARATSLVRTLTDVQSLDTGDFVLDIRRVDLRGLIAPVVRMLDRMSERHPVALMMPDDSVVLECDAQRLTQVFENLVSNAIKYSPDGGPVEVTLARHGDEAAVTVRDHGIGISAETLPRLFERGYRAPEAAATAPGLGLGLSIAAEIVKCHGGTIEARSEHPRGTIVTVRLPISNVPTRTRRGIDEVNTVTGKAVVRPA